MEIRASTSYRWVLDHDEMEFLRRFMRCSGCVSHVMLVNSSCTHLVGRKVTCLRNLSKIGQKEIWLSGLLFACQKYILEEPVVLHHPTTHLHATRGSFCLSWRSSD